MSNTPKNLPVTWTTPSSDCCEHCKKHLDPIHHVPMMTDYTRAAIQNMETHPWQSSVRFVGGEKFIRDLEILYTRIIRIRWNRGSRTKLGIVRGHIGRLEIAWDPIPKNQWKKRARKP